MPRYNPAEIERFWQKYWEENDTFKTPEEITGEKIYALDMFPYPSGAGLHVGHPEGYTATDILCRFERMRGKSVLHPMGFDAFGLPAEEYAIKTNTPPRKSTEKNIATFTCQLKMLGFSYDWNRAFATTDVDYFKWTQWIFLKLFNTWFDEDQQKGRPIEELPIPDEVTAQGDSAVSNYRDEFRLAYQGDALVNWCAGLGTVLANEEVIDGKSERGGHRVTRIPMRQWMLRITSYADRLEKDLEMVDWPEGIRKLQKDWIGKSTGAEVDFYIGGADSMDAWTKARKNDGFPKKAPEDVLRVYTTRPDTLFGATYMVIAPEHPFVEKLTTSDQKAAVESYCQTASMKSDRERQEEKKKKTGVFTGSFAINPANGKPIPIWIADYVLISYGTGAIMAVPGQDVRDWEFAEVYKLEIIRTVQPTDDFDGKAFTGDGPAINSEFLDGMKVKEAKSTMISWLGERGFGNPTVNYKLRDWLFSRQRFWGEPFPILHELDENDQPTGVLRAVDEKDLPVDLPHLDDYKPHGKPEPPLGKAPDEWLYPIVDGKKYRRETNTMPQWAGSCWYYLRYIDPKNSERFVDPEKEKAWMPVDLYMGGAEHAVLHLLYARFWHKVLFDHGEVSTAEPFMKLVNQGMILGEAELTGYQNAQGEWVSKHLVKEDKETNEFQLKADPSVVLNPVSIKDKELVEKKGENFVLIDSPEIQVDSRAHKMSKARGNVVNPDDVVGEYGADSLRLYEMFMGPLTATKPWNMNGVNGVKGFLDRVWRMIINRDADEMEIDSAVKDVEPTKEQNRVLHSTIKAVTHDIEVMSYNTGISRMMEFCNFFTKQEVRPKSAMEALVLLLSPYAPHIAEELWKALGHETTLAFESWPEFDESLTKADSIEVAIQIMGKVKTKIQVAPDISKDDLEAAALADEKIKQLLEGKTIRKTIVVPGRLVNFVAN